jgi:hypothetical protein
MYLDIFSLLFWRAKCALEIPQEQEDLGEIGRALVMAHERG